MFQLQQPGQRGTVGARWFSGFSQKVCFPGNTWVWSNYLTLKNIFQSSPFCGIMTFDMKNTCAAVCLYFPAVHVLNLLLHFF